MSASSSDELIVNPELLDAYGRYMSRSDPLTLAIVGDDIAGLQTAVERVGLAADLLAVAPTCRPRRPSSRVATTLTCRASTSRRSTSCARSRSA